MNLDRAYHCCALIIVIQQRIKFCLTHTCGGLLSRHKTVPHTHIYTHNNYVGSTCHTLSIYIVPLTDFNANVIVFRITCAQ